jgi:hypothetical protein
MENYISLETIKAMTEPTDSFLVKLEDNTYGIRFKGFRLRDLDTGDVYHEFSTEDEFELDYFADHELNYEFPYKILQAQTIGSNLTLVVGDELVKDLDLIERHYINDELVANYHFEFPVFMPSSENNIEFIYEVPKLSDETLEAISEEKPVKARSDTFILVEKQLVVHRRANYTYLPDL